MSFLKISLHFIFDVPCILLQNISQNSERYLFWLTFEATVCDVAPSNPLFLCFIFYYLIQSPTPFFVAESSYHAFDNETVVLEKKRVVTEY